MAGQEDDLLQAGGAIGQVLLDPGLLLGGQPLLDEGGDLRGVETPPAGSIDVQYLHGRRALESLVCHDIMP
jgi:hypothetical protein